MDEPDIGEFHDDEHALYNMGLAPENVYLRDNAFPKKHTAANISDHLLNAHIDFGVWPKDAEGRIPKSEEALRFDKLTYFGMEPLLDRPVLTSDCESDVSVGAKRNSLWDWNCCACHRLNIAVQSALKCPCIQKFVEPLVELTRKFSRTKSLWMEFKKVQLEMLHWEAECSDDEGDADFDGEEGLLCDAQGKPQMKKVLRLLTSVSICWNSMYYLIQRALVLKDPLIKFTNRVRSTFLGEVPLLGRALMMIALMLPFGVHLATKSPLALTSSECCVCVEILAFQLGHWQCYQELEKCLEPLKQLSLLLELSTEATIHNTSNYFLALLYHKLGKSPKSGNPACEVFNEFVDNF